ncbi:hypothetical protein HMI54_002723 [Coelomomyces lativittatus]|nr:hypothetical protein HMI54_002723 [Coelomomyces lativittatus]
MVDEEEYVAHTVAFSPHDVEVNGPHTFRKYEVDLPSTFVSMLKTNQQTNKQKKKKKKRKKFHLHLWISYDNGTLTWSATGQPCPDGTQSSTEIRFPCFHSLQTSPKVIFGRDLCGKTIFEWPSSVGCPVTASSSGGGLVTHVQGFILFVSYFGIGYLFLHFKLGYEGWEALPHYESIRQFIDWIRFKWSGAGRIRI